MVQFSSPAQAGRGCTPEGGFCLESRARQGMIEYWGESRRACSLTVTIELPAGAADPSEKITTSMAGPGRKLLVSRAARSGLKDPPFSFHVQCGLVERAPDPLFPYALPFLGGKSVRVSQGFHGSYSHNNAANEYAVDFDVEENTPVYAAREGRVVEVVSRYTSGGPNEPEDHVNVVRVQHPDHSVGEYAHLRHEGAVVHVGQWIEQGTLLGFSGNTGHTTGPHLHFAVHVPIDGAYRRSIPIRFGTEGGAIQELAQGKEYRPVLRTAGVNRLPAGKESAPSLASAGGSLGAARGSASVGAHGTAGSTGGAAPMRASGAP